MRSVQTAVASAATATVLALSALPAQAQGVRYSETTRVEMAGAMGAMMSMMGGGADRTTETVYLDGSRMRRDTDETSTIVDWSTGDMILLNHDQRTYRRFSWGDMVEGMTGRMEGARAEAGGMSDQDMPDYEVHFSTERTGRSERIAGYEADQVVMVIRFEGDPDAEAQPGQGMPMGGAMGNGAMAMVSELWLSTDFPAWTLMQEGRNQMAEEMRGALSGEAGMGGMAGAMGPRFQQALEEQQEAMADLEGMPLRSVINLVVLPGDVELDVDAVLAQEDLGGGMDAAAAARDAIAKRFNPFGGKDEEEKPEAAQSIMMRTVTEVDDVDASGVDPAVFEIPEGYTEATRGPGGR
jgi:hypothetical protein